MPDRRAAIADAAVRVIDGNGLRGLTHRAVDREAGYAEGTTSNYARTRRDLVELVVRRMAEQTTADVTPTGPVPATPEAAAALLAGIVDTAAKREGAARARFALALDLVHEPELRGLLTTASPVRRRLLALAEELLRAVGAADPERRAEDLAGLLNGLLFDRLSGPAPGSGVDVGSVVAAYLRGLPRR